MKRIAWIAVVALGVLVVANGITTEVPDTKAPGGYGGAVAERAKQPEPEAPAAFAGGVSQAARTPEAPPRTGQTPPTFGGFAATSRTTGRRTTTPTPAPASRRAMGFAATTPRSQTPGASGAKVPRKPLEFRLRNVETGATYGPFPLKQGVNIAIGDEAYQIEVVEGFEEVKELRTREQSALEGKLRRTILPEMRFEEAQLTEALDYLSREADVNIVIVDRVRKAAPRIDLRLRNVPLYDAIRYVTEVVGIYFRIDDHAVVITDRPTSSRVGR